MRRFVANLNKDAMRQGFPLIYWGKEGQKYGLLWRGGIGWSRCGGNVSRAWLWHVPCRDIAADSADFQSLHRNLKAVLTVYTITLKTHLKSKACMPVPWIVSGQHSQNASVDLYLNRIFALLQEFDTAKFQIGIAISPRNIFLAISFICFQMWYIT
jgi:hypothetical protein